MNMKKISIFSLVFFTFIQPLQAATYQCTITPTETRVGQVPNKEAYLIVCQGSECYNLGIGSEDQAKNRYAAAMAALVAGKRLMLTFYNRTCDVARVDFVTPNGTRLMAN